jgi:chromosome segregation ATPase
MKPREIILILVAAAFGGIAVVSWSAEAAANSRADAIRNETNETLRANGAKLVAAERKAEESVTRLKAAQAAESAAAAKAAASIDGSKQVVVDLAKAKEDLAKAATKIAELEKARSEASSRINELNAEIARLRDGSEVKIASEKQKKAEADLEAASVALREANVKAASALARLAELEEENRRLRDQNRGSENASPNYRAL